MRGLLVCLAVLVSGCATTPTPLPPVQAVIVCAPDPGMAQQDPQPLRPAGDYSQRDVADYLTALHQWARRGWQRLQAVADEAEDCFIRSRNDG